jgi:hypothetical protein
MCIGPPGVAIASFCTNSAKKPHRISLDSDDAVKYAG